MDQQTEQPVEDTEETHLCLSCNKNPCGPSSQQCRTCSKFGTPPSSQQSPSPQLLELQMSDHICVSRTSFDPDDEWKVNINFRACIIFNAHTPLKLTWLNRQMVLSSFNSEGFRAHITYFGSTTTEVEREHILYASHGLCMNLTEDVPSCFS